MDSGNWIAKPSKDDTVLNGLTGKVNQLIQKSGGGGGQQDQKKSSNEKDLSQVECYKCHSKGHYANKCPENKDSGEEGKSLNSNNNANDKKKSWKKTAPKSREANTKTAN